MNALMNKDLIATAWTDYRSAERGRRCGGDDVGDLVASPPGAELSHRAIAVVG